jgi:hypothetical protein
MLNQSAECGQLCLFPEFRGNHFSLFPFSVMFTIGLSYIAFIRLRYIPSIPSYIRAHVMKRYWVLSKVFSVSIEMIMWLLSLLLLIYCITFNDLHIVNYPWDEIDLIMVYDMLLDSICQYFIEDFCIYVH